MAFDFPSSPSAGQEFTPAGGPTYVWQSPRWLPKAGAGGGGASVTIGDTPPVSPTTGSLWYESDSGNTFIWYNDGDSSQWVQVNVMPTIPSGLTAETRNRLVNPCFQISQENGNTLVPGLVFAADEWRIFGSGTAGISSQRVQVVTPNGSVNRLRYTITLADTSLTAGEYIVITQLVEGVRVADFRWGSAAARQAVLRFGWKSPAGTYTVSIRNVGGTRTFLASFTVSAGQANTDTEQTFVIPGDTTGTWVIDTGLGLNLSICLGAGSGIGVAGWQAGDLIAVAAQTNGLASTSNVFELYDVGLYMDPLNTGTPPAWTMPDEAQELIACQRYFQKFYTLVETPSLWQGFAYPVEFRVAPAIAGGGAGFNLFIAIPQYFVGNQTARAVPLLSYNARM